MKIVIAQCPNNQASKMTVTPRQFQNKALKQKQIIPRHLKISKSFSRLLRRLQQRTGNSWRKWKSKIVYNTTSHEAVKLQKHAVSKKSVARTLQVAIVKLFHAHRNKQIRVSLTKRLNSKIARKNSIAASKNI